MKRFFCVLMCMVLCLICSSCNFETTNPLPVSKSNDESVTLLIKQKKVKISYEGISSDVGIGEGIILLVENNRKESIIVNIVEVSLNGVMQAVIQLQMPLHLTSSNKKSNQPFVFSNIEKLTGEAQFKIKVMNEDFKEIFTSDFVKVSF